MIIESVRLNDFRNYEHLELLPDRGTNVFHGDNAQGKTNILEAVFLCGTTRSHRLAKDRDMIRFGCEEAHIRMQLQRGNAPYRIDMHLKRGRAKGIAVNQVPIKKAGELIGLGHYIFFSPEDLGIIKNGPSERRRYIDMQLCQMSPSYLFNLSNYQKALLQRNKLLKDLSFRPDNADTLELWDEQLVRFGMPVIEERERFLEELMRIASVVHGDLTGGKEKLRILYEKNIPAHQFLQALEENREKDLRSGTTNAGPHRDDLCLQNGEEDLRRYGSQGQQRTAALSLKLAEIDMVQKKKHELPVLLLDDVLSELDSSRQRFLLEKIHNIQTFITCTGVEDFMENQFSIDSLFEVRDGIVRKAAGSFMRNRPKGDGDDPFPG